MVIPGRLLVFGFVGEWGKAFAMSESARANQKPTLKVTVQHYLFPPVPV